MEKRKIVVLGGGVGGLSAAHELIERSGDGVEFEIHVYERRDDFVGGKARSTPVFTKGATGRGPLPDVRVAEAASDWHRADVHALPGEHGFRFFPGFYRHLPDTMKRIPTDSGTAFDNLTVAKNLLLARSGARDFFMPTGVPHSLEALLADLREWWQDRHSDLGLTLHQIETFGTKLWRILTMCDDRRLAELETQTWWDYLEVGAPGLGGAYESLLAEGLSRSLLANNPRVASARTVGNTNIQLIFDVLDPDREADRLLDGPTSLAWLTPWRRYLTGHENLHIHMGAEVLSIETAEGAVRAARIRIDGHEEDVTGDHFIAALPVERMAEIVAASPGLMEADPALKNIPALKNSTGRMYGVQFYLTRDVEIVDGHALYVDSPWALTSISEVQFWKGTIDIAQCDDGQSRGLISVCVSEWAQAGIDGAPPAMNSPSREALVAQVWEQLKAALNDSGHEELSDADLHAWYLDEDVTLQGDGGPMQGREPLFINRVGDWHKRPGATTSIPNLFLASDYVRTFTDVACMEAANEAARRAVNAILERTGSKAKPCELWPLEEPALFKPFRKADRERFDRGLPWIGRDRSEISPYPAPTARFVERSAEQCHLQPFVCDDISMFGFFLKGERAPLQAFVDKCLNEPTGGATDYRVLSDLVLCTFADVRIGTSTQPPDSQQGYIPELSCTFWIPTAAYEGGEAVRMAQFVPYIIVDNAWSMAAGREIYGFPKEIGTFTLPTDPETADRFEVSTTTIGHFSPKSLAEVRPLVRIERTDDDGIIGWIKEKAGLLEGGADMAASMLHDIWGGDIGKAFMTDLLADAADKAVPVAFLKQFRDAADGRFACYQAIVETDITTSHIEKAGFLPGVWSCRVFDYDSHPLRRELGFEAEGDLECIFPFHVKLNFTAGTGREVWRAGAPTHKKKIAVLGGGVGAMTAAYELTEQENWQDLYDITVYQMGWRLGGKGASGRNRDLHDRIEEHGLHLWFGYYHNAFDLMRRAYAANDRPKGAPLATVEDAFKPHGQITVCETEGADWNLWKVDVPIFSNNVPGDEPPLSTMLARMLGAIIHMFENEVPHALKEKSPVHAETREHHHSLLEKVRHAIGEAWDDVKDAALHPDLKGLRLVHRLLEAHAEGKLHESLVDRLLHEAGIAAGPILRRLAELVLKVLEAVIAPWVKRLVEVLEEIEKTENALGLHGWTVRRCASLLELGLANIRGLVEDDVIEKGFAPLNRYDYREWLARHGGTKLSVDADVIRVAYETIFAFERGDTTRPNLAAGAAAYGLMRLCFGWHGAIMFKMQAGMGDTVFGPLYEVLRKRGVKFRYFHKVEKLGLDVDKRAIEAIDMAEQVAVKADAYDPLIDVNGLPCWPSRPLYDQIVDGEALKQNGENLESHWCRHEPYRRFTLRRGIDFDEVVLGISVGGLPFVAKELIDASPAWQRMIEGVPTVQTQAFQMWMRPDLPSLGWPVSGGEGPHPAWTSPRTPVLGGYKQPQNTWADMSHLIPRESWDDGKAPGSVAYFCGPMAGPETVPATTDTQFPVMQTATAKAYALQWTRDNIGALWPTSVRKGDPDGRTGFVEGFDWSLLLDEGEREGPARFDGQFWRANVDPTERYALSPKGGIMARLPSGDTGYDNLVMAGDWTKNGLDIGCVEAAATSGMDAAKALVTRVKAMHG